MKKMMFAIVAAAVGCVMAGDEITSQTVGYNKLDTGDSYQMLGASFKDTAGVVSGIALGQLTGSFVDEDEIQVSYVDDDGLIQFDSFFYYTSDGDYAVDEDGWYNGGMELSKDYVIPTGSAVWFISSDGSGKGVTTSGSVDDKQIVHPKFLYTYNMICSAFPVAFNPNSASWSGLVDEDEIQVASVDNEGLIQFESFFYYTSDGDYAVDEDGWYNGGMEYVSTPICAVGQGFWLIINNPSDVTMTENSPLAE